MRFTEITDDLTGAADSGSYFTARGQQLKICTSGESSLNRSDNELLSVNLCSRNVEGEVARRVHSALLKRLSKETGHIYMKKIGTGFRGNDSYELEGLLQAWPDYLVFLIDNAPDLGTFTLYGHQYCEGEILPKSLYAKDPIFPPKESYIPDILSHGTKLPIGLVDIDTVKGGDLAGAVQQQISRGCRILVFDAITKRDTLHIIRTLQPLSPKVFWTGSLGLADGLAEYLYGPEQPLPPAAVRQVRCLGFCASAYEIAKKQLAYSQSRGLTVVPVEIDAYIEGDQTVPHQAAAAALDALAHGNVILAPAVERYSYQPGTSVRIMECFGTLAPLVCESAVFDRLIIVGGETSQAIFRHLHVNHLELGRALEPGVAQGRILDGALTGREFALKGGSMGSVPVLEKMMCRWEDVQ